MTKTTAIISAVFALGVMFAAPAMAGADKNGGSVVSGCSTCSGGSGGAPQGYTVNDFKYVTNSHSKNGGSSHNSNGGGYQREDNYVCVVGPRVAYVVSALACRKLVHAYLSGHGYGHGNYVSHGGGRKMSYATRMQQKKRYAKAYHGKVRHASKLRHGKVTSVRSRSGNTYNINNYGTININKGGAW